VSPASGLSDSEFLPGKQKRPLRVRNDDQVRFILHCPCLQGWGLVSNIFILIQTDKGRHDAQDSGIAGIGSRRKTDKTLYGRYFLIDFQVKSPYPTLSIYFSITF
jgi:hypothetical protein